MINIEDNYYDIDICDCCESNCDPSNIKTITLDNIRLHLCTNCRKLLLNKLKEDLNEI